MLVPKVASPLFTVISELVMVNDALFISRIVSYTEVSPSMITVSFGSVTPTTRFTPFAVVVNNIQLANIKHIYVFITVYFTQSDFIEIEASEVNAFS